MAANYLTIICKSERTRKLETKLYIGNMSYDTTEDQLRTLFGEAGTVGSVDIIKDRDSGRPKGFAFVMMSSQAEAEKAISMFNGKSVNDRALTVNLARPREERDRGGTDNFSRAMTHRRRGGSSSRY